MATGLESAEAPVDLTVDQVNDQVNPILAKGRALGGGWDPPKGEERPYIQFGWTKPNGPTSANDVYVGFGGCRYHRVAQKEIDLNEGQIELEEHLRLYERALRTQCVGYETDFNMEMLKSGLLVIGEDKSFELQEKSVHL